VILVILQVAIITALAPLVQGAMRRLRARLQGRPGPVLIQPYRDLAKLWKKEALLPEGTSLVAAAAPGFVMGVALTFAAALPLTTGASAIIDIVALAFLLASGRFVLSLAALDTRSAFVAMAASREMAFASLAEPTLVIALLGAATLGRGPLPAALSFAPFSLAGALAFLAFFIVVLFETARIPVDNQETHYELTMIHEGLTLEYSGWHLMLVQYAAYIRQLCFFMLASLLLPGSNLFAHVGWACALAITITIVETMFARLRLFEVPELLTTALILAATSIGLRIAGGSV
jgi:formate hydrogenlyase subunit 4